MRDKRIQTLAHNLVNYSCKIQPGEKLLVEMIGVDPEIGKAIAEETYAVGGHPFIQVVDPGIKRAIMMGMTDEQAALMAKYDAYRMSDMDAYIGIRGGDNLFEEVDVPAEQRKAYQLGYSKLVHMDIRLNHTKWCVMRWPNHGMAQSAGQSTEAFEDFYFDVCCLDYSKMDRAMDALKALMERTDKVRLVAQDTDITFSIKGMPAIKCAGSLNIPDGEIYSAPVKNSVNGVIHYNTPSMNQGKKFEDVRLTFRDGKIVEATANDTETINKIFDVDDGARYVGEFAIGVNPYINKPMLDTLFDEKIAGSIHFTPGNSYDDCDNGNKSALHWDLVLIMTPEYGGGEIWFDDVLIRKDGRFVLPELECLNPENLK